MSAAGKNGFRGKRLATLAGTDCCTIDVMLRV